MYNSVVLFCPFILKAMPKLWYYCNFRYREKIFHFKRVFVDFTKLGKTNISIFASIK